MKYEVRVDGRLFEISKNEERKEEIVKILKQVYPDSEITVKATRK